MSTEMQVGVRGEGQDDFLRYEPPTPNPTILRETLKHYLHTRGMSQKELARQISRLSGC